jgi:hypothetical protein
MKYFILAILIILIIPFIGPAKAGTITVTIVTASGVCSPSCTKTYTDTDANLARIIPAYQGACNIKLIGVCTPIQVLVSWFDGVIASVVSQVTTIEKNNLSNTATSGYTPINPQ